MIEPTTIEETRRLRNAFNDWQQRSVKDRLQPVRALRHLLVDRRDALTDAVQRDVQREPGEVTTTDILPSAAACKFLEKRAEGLLKPQRIGDRPTWLFGSQDMLHRRPHGIVGLIATWNYPIFLTLVPIVQALVAGNVVLWKPSEQAPRTSDILLSLLREAGFPTDTVLTVEATREAGPRLIEADIDFLHFTGSDSVGRKIASRLGERLIPSTLELSGVDALILTETGDVQLATRTAVYGATLNNGQTCMAIRRLFVPRAKQESVIQELQPLIDSATPHSLQLPQQFKQTRELLDDATSHGGTILGKPSSDNAMSLTVVRDATPEMAICNRVSFAPILAVIPYDETDDVAVMHNRCPFGLSGAIVSGDDNQARELAAKLRTGSVVINDVIVPTAHPATPFGGRGSSGWGVTQGADGLLAMTVPQVVSLRSGTFRPHIDSALKENPAADRVAEGMLRLTHARTLGERWRGLKQLIGGMRAT